VRIAPSFAPDLPSTNGHSRVGPGTLKVLTASADAGGGQLGNATGTGGSSRPGKQLWQGEGWGYYDTFPELHYGAQFVGSCWSRVKLRLGWVNDNGDVAAIYNEDGEIDEDCPSDVAALIPRAQATLAAFTDPLGGTGALLEAGGKNFTITGEFHLLAQDYHDGNGKVIARRWEVLSTDEIRRKSDVRRDRATGKAISPEFERVYPGQRGAEDIPLDQFVLRVYRRHPRWSYLADSATRPLLDTMEVLVLLTRQLRATVLSRLAGAGVLFIPTEIDFPDDETAPEGSEQSDPFATRLIKAMTVPIRERGAAGSVVPFVVRADADLIPAIHHLTFDSKDDDVAIAKMDALLLRFAQGMDLPMEVIMGHQQTTFANAVQIDESTYKAHIEPGVGIFCGFLTAGYLWKSLGAPEPADAPQDAPVLLPVANSPITRLRIIADASALVTHEHREENAIKAREMSPPIISESSTRTALGFTDADAPTDEERDEWIRVQQLIGVKESIRAEEPPGAAPSLVDPDVQKALDDVSAPADANDVSLNV